MGAVEFVTTTKFEQSRVAELSGHVSAVQTQLYEELGIESPAESIKILIYPNRREYYLGVRRFIPSIAWSDTAGRHGLFLLRDGVAHLFVLESEDLSACLRHETVHAVLNLQHPGLPIWLDEGLAQCYAQPDGSHYSRQAAIFLKRDWLHAQPMTQEELSRLNDMRQMTPRAYAAAWALVYAALQSTESRTSLRQLLESQALP